ncbi:hypothetical protein HALLA_13805 [Halostagnicola larsenii XH-48]|uniref:Uncharacterized protein n=1 Tax=Halostagnicola larsenii XH-48 TaxID=797299 RepID=W0JM72_9EURY|nr:hypothetical protein [Halostagnicola larsenii]AHF99698.1 hypothetical protein HALLA_13805 [Halostagnicola larsenii XH-48]
MSTDVSESTGYGPNLEMSTLGYIVAVLIAILLLPLLPVAVVGYVLYRVFTPSDGEPARRGWNRDFGGPGDSS